MHVRITVNCGAV